MKSRTRFTAILIALLFSVRLLPGQAASTASRPLDLSTFVGISGTDTGLNGGRNFGVTAGMSLAFPRSCGLIPSAEIRGTTPLSEGSIVSEKNATFGLQIAKPIGRVQPFANLLFGRGQFSYLNGGMPVPQTNVIYTKSASNLFSPGFGALLEINSAFSVRADAQFEFFKTPVITSEYLISIPLTLGIVYHFPSTTHGHPYP
jgi:hypothetical protein